MSCSTIADDLADSAALVEALQRGDAEAVECLLRLGDPAGIALILGSKLAVALRQVDAESAATIIGGWRRDAEDRRESGWPT